MTRRSVIAVFLLIFLLSPVAYSGIRSISHISGDIVFDGCRFENIPSEVPDSTVIDRARVRMRDTRWSGFPHEPASRAGINRNLSGMFRPRSEFSFRKNRSDRTITAGNCRFPSSWKKLSEMDGWTGHAPQNPNEIGIFINNTKGRNTIVLVDPKRGDYLSISN